jgi:predicted DNA-binding protein with PD1-like motif
MDTLLQARLGRIYFAQLSPGEDLYTAIKGIAVSENIHTGVILSITGALAKTKLSTPRKPEGISTPPGVIEFEGTAEATGTGYFGMTEETWESPASSISHIAGEPFLHVHLTVSVGGETHMGHLVEGCEVRSLHAKSHFALVLAETEGVDLRFRNALDEATDAYPQGLPYYELKAV